MDKTYIISEKSNDDVISLFGNLTKIRALLPVQMSPEEEEIMRVSSWSLVRNRVFFQHPDLIRILRVHENVMDVMVNTLGKRAQTQPSQGEKNDDKNTSQMVVSCCRFLCYFCRTGRINQKAMFDHLDFVLENANILLCEYVIWVSRLLTRLWNLKFKNVYRVFQVHITIICYSASLVAWLDAVGRSLFVAHGEFGVGTCFA